MNHADAWGKKDDNDVYDLQLGYKASNAACDRYEDDYSKCYNDCDAPNAKSRDDESCDQRDAFA